MVAALALACSAACAGAGHRDLVYGAGTARLGDSLAVLGWNTSVSNLRWQDDYVLVDVDAAPTDPAKAHANPRDVRFGLYDALAHPMEAAGIGSLILREASLDAVHVSASLCTQGDINEALLYATVAIVGTHAAVWTTR